METEESAASDEGQAQKSPGPSDTIDSDQTAAAEESGADTTQATPSDEGDAGVQEIRTLSELELANEAAFRAWDAEDAQGAADENPEQQPASGDAETEETEDQPEEKGEAEEPEEEDPEDKEEDDPEGEPKRRPKFRVTPKSELDTEILAAYRRNQDLTLDEAAAIARKKLGIEEKSPEGEKPEGGDSEDGGEENDDGLPKTAAEMEEYADELAQQRTAAAKELDFEKAADLDEQIRQADKATRRLAKAEAEAEKAQQEKFYQEVESSKAEAVALYPDCANAESELSQRMQEINDSFKDTDNPLYYDANKPFKLAQMAANDLGIAPQLGGKKKAAPAAEKKSERRPVSKAPGSLPAPGSASTQPPKGDGSDDFLKAIRQVQTTDQLEALNEAI